jgi:hypothetical protein
MLWTVGKYIIVGVTMGAIVERYMPTDWIYSFFGRKDPLNIVWVTVASVPMFLHQLSASSIISHIKGALGGTLDSGAALAFMIGGPVTAVPTMILFWTIFKKRVFALYMFVCLAGTMIIAYGFQLFVFVPGVDTGNELLKGVSTLSGGKSRTLKKTDHNVRMVIDPGGNGLIATFRNDLDSRGGVVFDAGFGRYPGSSADKNDNRKYLRNLAKWLEQNSSSHAARNVLIYDLSLDSEGVLSKNSLSDLAEAGFKVKVLKRRDSPGVTADMIAGYGQLWLFYDTGAGLSDPEQKVVSQFSGDGGAMLVVAGGNKPGAGSMDGVNRLTAGYGVTFSEDIRDNGEIHVGIASRFLGNASELLGRFLKIVHKA